MEIYGTIQAGGTVRGQISLSQTVGGSISVPHVIEPERYTGAYEVTPSDQTQTLATEGLAMTADIIINPIPSNYGLIAWDGSTITVS